jgi:hypothetical protein
LLAAVQRNLDELDNSLAHVARTKDALAAFSHEEQEEQAIRVLCRSVFSAERVFGVIRTAIGRCKLGASVSGQTSTACGSARLGFVFLLFQQRSAVQTAAKTFCQG